MLFGCQGNSILIQEVLSTLKATGAFLVPIMLHKPSLFSVLLSSSFLRDILSIIKKHF